MTTPSTEIRPGRQARQVEGVFQIIIMLAIGGAAGAASFTHVHNVAAAHGQGGWLAWADAVVLELMSIASGLELRRRKRQHKSAGFPAAVMGCAVALSISAQVVEAELSVIGWLAAALPALGFLVMVKIAIGRTPSVDSTSSSEHPPAPVSTSRDAITGNDGIAAVDGNGPVEAKYAVGSSCGRRASAANRRSERSGRSDPESSASKPAADLAEFADVADLLPAATATYSAITQQGQAVTHKALTGRLRANGYAVSNARGATLLKILKDGNHRPD